MHGPTHAPLTSLVAALLLAISIPGSAALAQAAPSTDIHLVSIDLRGERASVGAPVNVTARAGYDNQPAFTADGASILFTSVREDAQADIYRYGLATRGVTRVTRTVESEYSATPMPDGRRLSVIRVEPDSTQRLWSFASDGTDPQLVLRDVKPVGYHAWANDSILALFVLGSPATLQVANARTGTSRVVLGGIGRSIHRIPGTVSISFVHKQGENDWWIKRLDPVRYSAVALVQTLEGSEDYAWLPDGSVLMARANTLYRWSPRGGGAGARTEWSPIATFDAPGLQRISRLAVSPDGRWIALVSAEAAR